VSQPPLRYLPDRPFPGYAFLPGRDPHPTRDPRGHSYAEPEGAPHIWRPDDQWRENHEYLFGCDLYNAGYLWEAHEAWEDIWHPSKPDAIQAEFLQGLILCTAASLKIPMEQPGGLVKLAANGTSRLEVVLRSEGPSYMGLELPDFIDSFREFAGSSSPALEDRPRIKLLF
jgi:hypothetical protein